MILMVSGRYHQSRRSGDEELLGLGRRWAQRLPTLTSGPHDWVYTDTQVSRKALNVAK